MWGKLSIIIFREMFLSFWILMNIFDVLLPMFCSNFFHFSFSLLFPFIFGSFSAPSFCFLFGQSHVITVEGLRANDFLPYHRWLGREGNTHRFFHLWCGRLTWPCLWFSAAEERWISIVASLAQTCLSFPLIMFFHPTDLQLLFFARFYSPNAHSQLTTHQK